jgi:WD40 repeat protein/serine/threonine protein kinase
MATELSHEPQAAPLWDAERRVEQAAEQYLERVRSGAGSDRHALLDANADIAPLLARRLAVLDAVLRATRRESAQDTPRVSGGDTAPSEPAASGPDARAATWLAASNRDAAALAQTVAQPERDRPEPGAMPCPHCGTGVPVVAFSPSHRSMCSNCGSTFEIESDLTTASRLDTQPRRIGRFEVLDVLGQGAFGVVYLARDDDLDRQVAIKMPREGYFRTRNEEARFLREARNAARLNHPHIVPVHEIAFDRQTPYIVSEYVPGTTLEARLRFGRLDFCQAAQLMATVASAVAYAHSRQIIHRDLKPSNILIDEQGLPHVTDFGLSCRDDDEITVTETGQILGTPAYMPPEQAAGDHAHVAARSDVYSLGVILYRLLTGELPFSGTRPMVMHQLLHDDPRPPRRLNHTVPRDLETICLKAMAKEPSRRYATGDELADDLRRWLNHEPVLARPATRTERVWRWSKRNPLLAGLTACVGLLLSLLGGGGTLAAWHERSLRHVAEVQRRESVERLAALHVQRGVDRLDDGDTIEAAAWFAAAMALETDNPRRMAMHRIRLGSALRHSPKLVRLWVHPGPVRHAQLSADATRALTASADGTVQVWDVATGLPVLESWSHGAAVTAAQFSADARLVITSSADKTAQVKDLATHRGTILRHADRVNDATIGPDGRWIATACSDLMARIWTQDGVAVRTLEHDLPAQQVTFSRDGTRLLTVSGTAPGRAGTARVWDVATGRLLAKPLVHSDWIWSAAFSPNGLHVATASSDATACIWDIATGQRLTTLRHDAEVRFVAYSPDGRHVATASYDGAARVWDAASGALLSPALRHTDVVTHVAFDDTGQSLVSTSSDGTARVWDWQRGLPAAPSLRHADTVWRAEIVSAGRLVLTASADFTVRMWDLAGSVPVSPALHHQDMVLQATFSRDGRRVGTASRDGTAAIWDVAAAAPQKPGRVLKHDDEVMDISFSPDGQHVVTASWDGTARVWEAGTGQPAKTPLLRHAGGVRLARYAPNGKWLLTASADHTARIWDAATGALRATLHHGDDVLHAAFSADGRWVATASADRTARVWDAETGQPSLPLNHQEAVHGVAFRSDAGRVVTASLDQTAGIWDVRTNRLGPPLLRHSGAVWTAVFRPDGQEVLTASFDGVARAWDVDTGRPTTRPMVHRGMRVHGASYSSDGSMTVTAAGRGSSTQTRRRTWDGMARVWDADTGEALTPPLVHAGQVLRAVISPDGTRVLSASQDGTAQLWEIAPDARPAPDLIALAQLLAGHRVDDTAGSVPLDLPALTSAWELLRTRYPDTFQCSGAERAAWQRWTVALRAEPRP